jgi:hypothetical protein
VRSSCYGGSNDESRETTEATTAAAPEAASASAAVVSSPILKRAPIGWNKESYDVLEDGARLSALCNPSLAPGDFFGGRGGREHEGEGEVGGAEVRPGILWRIGQRGFGMGGRRGDHTERNQKQDQKLH